MKHLIIITLISVCLLSFGYIPVPNVAADSDITAASGSAADIQAAADIVYAAGGGTVRVPAGTFSLGGSATIQDNVRLIGAGSDATILNTTGTSQTLTIHGDNVRLTGFALVNVPYEGGNGIYVRDAIDFRIDNLRIEGYGNEAAINVDGLYTRGVIDHCYIKSKRVSNIGYGVVVRKSTNWWPEVFESTPDVQQDAVFIEDNTFENCRHAVAGNNGAYYVFRYNHCIKGYGDGASPVDAHGPSHGGTGTRYIEVYNNLIEDPETSDDFAIVPRGGDGVIFNNTVHDYRWVVELRIDDEQSGSYPLPRQIRAFYIWGNTGSYSSGKVTVPYNSIDYIQEDRDYFLYPKPGYAPYPYPHPLTSADSNNPPVLHSIGDRTIDEGQPLQFTLSASDTNGDPLFYSAAGLPAGASFNAGARTFSWTPRYDQTGIYTTHFQVSDGVSTDSEDVTITVAQPYKDWDLNGDGAANVLDMVLVGQHWGESGLTGWIREDANEDGTINVLDIIIIGQNWTE